MRMDDTSMNTLCNWFVNKRQLDSFFNRYSLRYSIVLFCFLINVVISCSPGQESTSEDKKAYASLDSSVSYVGMETCKQCHADKYESYLRTGMGKSFGIASRQKSSASFEGSPVVYDGYENLNYHPHWIGDQFFIDEFRIASGDTIYKRSEQVSFIVGSGQHTNSHLKWTNGYLWQMPLTFYTQEKKWDLPPGFENGQNSRFGRKIESECISCHNGYPKLVAGSENKYVAIPNGIDCERCHGPGSRHVQLKQSGEWIDTAIAIDYSIVNPAKLPIDLQLDICQRCHIQGNSVLKRGKTYYDFKPGMHLSEVMDVYMPVYKGQEQEHIMASHAERMKMSACFITGKKQAEKSAVADLRPYKNAMTCVTCHNPHISVNETGKETYNNACKNCHGKSQVKTNATCSADMNLRKKRNDDCVGCHMPKNNTIDIPHVTTTDHYIRRGVDIKTKTAIKEFVTLACINNPQSDKQSRGEAFLNYYEKFVHDARYLDSAKFYLDDKSDATFLSNYEALVRWSYLKQDYNKVINYASRKANTNDKRNPKVIDREVGWTCYRIAESYQQLGDLKAALAYYQSAVTNLPYQLDFRIKLAGILDEMGNAEAARKEYLLILQEDPQNVSALVNYGYLLAASYQQTAEADKLYDKALSLDPDHIQALLNKTGTSVLKGDLVAARGFLSRALKLDPSNPQGLRMKSLLLKQ